jgi:hypothetical protein
MSTVVRKPQRRRSSARQDRLHKRAVQAKVTDRAERRRVIERATTRIKTTGRVDTVETS